MLLRLLTCNLRLPLILPLILQPPVPLSPADGFVTDFQVSCSTVPLSPGDGVAFVGLSDVLAAPLFLVVAFFAAVCIGFQSTVLALPEFRW